MRTRSWLSSSAVIMMVAGLIGIAAQPALAAPTVSVDTSVTFVVGPAPLTITVGDGRPVQLGRAEAGDTITGQMGTVTVTGPGSWVASVVATDFVTADEKPLIIPAFAVSYWSGPVLDKSGDGDFKPGQETAESAQPLDPREFRTAFTFNGKGSNFGTWNPTLVVSVPGESQPGTYAGTVTHSVV